MHVSRYQPSPRKYTQWCVILSCMMYESSFILSYIYLDPEKKKNFFYCLFVKGALKGFSIIHFHSATSLKMYKEYAPLQPSLTFLFNQHSSPRNVSVTARLNQFPKFIECNQPSAHHHDSSSASSSHNPSRAPVEASRASLRALGTMT